MNTIIRSCLFLGLILQLLSCSTTRPTGKTEAEVLFKEAKMMMEKGRYLNATERLNLLRKNYPFSYYATPAELMLADILYLQENYVESASAYILFKDLHPRHKKIAYVLWKIAESFYHQLPSTFDRDLSPGYESIKYYRELVSRFPHSEYVKKSLARVKDIEQRIKKKQKYIADFYFKTEVYDAAAYRYKLILDTFQDEKLRNHAIERTIKAYLYLKDKKQCREFYNEYYPLVKAQEKSKLKKLYQQCKEL